MQRIRLTLVSLAVALVTAVVFASPASATATTTTGLWNFSERSGPAIDSAGSQQNGTVGRLITRNGSTYRFPTSQGLPAADHLVVVGNNNVLNPGTSDFAVEVRFIT